jgi:hypothetical protein
MFFSMSWWNKEAFKRPVGVVVCLLLPYVGLGISLGSGPSGGDTLRPVDRCGQEALLETYGKGRLRAAKKPSEVPILPGGWTEDEEVWRIPVVFHVLHLPEDSLPGMGTNISIDQIQSQMLVLRQDFRRLAGTRGYNTQPAGADARLDFVLAGRDPSGQPSSGVVRVPYPGSSNHSMGSDLALKSLSRWPADRYVNIWVVGAIQGGVLGYAWLPLMLQGDPQATLVDGVVLIARTVGSADHQPYGIPFDLHPIYRYGRTLTHELGHYLDLYHTWGDGDCGVDDEVFDTPNCSGPLFGCPLPQVECPPALPRMVANFLDYTDDNCMNVFTAGQVVRMRPSLGPTYAWRSSLTSVQNLNLTGCTDSTRPRADALVALGSDTLASVNDTLGKAVRILLLDQVGRGLDSVPLVVTEEAGAEWGLRVLTPRIQTDAFGMASFRAVSAVKPGINRIRCTVDPAYPGADRVQALNLEWTTTAEAQFYPNPFKGSLAFQWPGRDRVSVDWVLADATGRTCRSGRYSGPAFWEPDWQDLPAQMYVLTLVPVLDPLPVQHLRLVKE